MLTIFQMASLSSLLMFIVVLPTLLHSLHIFDSVSNSISVFTTWRSIKMGGFRRFTSTEANEGVIRGHLGRIEPGDPLRVVAAPAWGERDMAWRLLKDHLGPAVDNGLTRKKMALKGKRMGTPIFLGVMSGSRLLLVVRYGVNMDDVQHFNFKDGSSWV